MSKLERVPASTNPVSVFAALGDRTRLVLLSRLNDGQSHSIAQLTVGLGLTRQGVAKHLRILAQAGIVESDRVGRETRFTFTPERLQEAQDYLGEISKQWDSALDRLKTHVES